jgi:hypothetical protein
MLTKLSAPAPKKESMRCSALVNSSGLDLEWYCIDHRHEWMTL